MDNNKQFAFKKQDINTHVQTQTKVRDKQQKLVIALALLDVVKGIFCPCHPIVLFFVTSVMLYPITEPFFLNLNKGVKSP